MAAVLVIGGCGAGDGDDDVAVRTVAAARTGGVPPAAPTYERRLVRTTETGITLRLYEAPEGLVVEVSNEAAVAREVVPTVPIDAGLGVLATGTFGEAEGSPAAWALLAADATEVRVRSADGHLDGMGPVGGLALLASPGSGGGTAETLGPDGEVLESTQLQESSDPVPAPGGATTTTAVEPTGPPPEDPVAAEAAVRDAFARAFSGSEVGDDSLDLTAVEDGDEVEVASALSAATSNFSEAVRTARIDVSEVRFLDAGTASVRYEIRYSGGVEFGPQDDGRAQLVEGSWLVDRRTFCMVMGWAGGQC